jgi:leucyl aminopeptidase
MPDPSLVLLPSTRSRRAIPIVPLTSGSWPGHERALGRPGRTWLKTQGFAGQPGRHALLPGKTGDLERVFYGVGEARAGDPFDLARLARALPNGVYRLEGELPGSSNAVLGWLLESYRFDRYRAASSPFPRLVCPPQVDREVILRTAEAHFMVRDLVNTPSADMGPDELEKAARQVAGKHRAKLSVVAGERLRREFPMIYAVGQASTRRPRLIDFTWGPAKAPKVTLVG